MKRVQAMVSGRKKQCTKLPKPAVKEKKVPTTPDVNSSRHSRNALEDKGADKEDGSGGHLATSAAGSVSSPGSTITAKDPKRVITTSPPPSRTASKIPGTSPKKSSRDGGGWMLSRKGQQRQDKPGVSKSESFNKKSSKEKQKSNKVSDSAGEPVTSVDSGSKSGQKMAGRGEAGYVTENRYTDPSLDVEKKGETTEENKPTSSPPETASTAAVSPELPQPKTLDETGLKDARLQGGTSNGAGRQSDQNTVSSQQAQSTENQRTTPQPQNNQPLHGILKDSGSGNESSGSTNITYHQNGSEHLYNVPSTHTRDHSTGRNSQPTRAASFRDNPTQFYQQPYGSLPRNSRSTTPTPEMAYNYGSFPRRSHVSAPKQQNEMYNGPEEWSSLSRKAESDFVYPVGQMDRDRGSGRSNNLGINLSKSSYGITGYSNDYYGVVGPGYHTQRSSSSSNDPRSAGYRVARNGMGASQYNSDNDAARYQREVYNRGVRGGSVPLGYESDSGAYGAVVHGQPRFGSIPRSYEAGADLGGGSGASLRVHPGDEQYRAGPGKRPIPRRHTVGTSANRTEFKYLETDRKREAFMQLLAQRYPQYADRIQGAVAQPTPAPLLPDKPSRSREGQRRRTALVAYNPNVTSSSLEYDDIGAMTDLEVSASFHRGAFSRTSLPIVRSASTSLERPLGLVFLVYGDQTKKSLLPNEITTLDTVRALFVRAFADLTLESLEDHRKKIYLLDPATNIYFQLEDLADIKDRSVLKIHETDNDQPQKVKERQEVRGRTVQMAAARSHPGQPYGEVPLAHNDMLIKSQSLLPQHSHNYQEMMLDQRSQWERERRSRSRTPEPADRSQRSMSAGTSSKQRQGFSHSPDHLPTQDRLHGLNSIPENRQIPLGHAQPGNYYESVTPGVYRGQYPSGIYESPVSYQGYPSAPPAPSQQTYVACSTRASPMTYPQRAVAPGLEMNAGFQRSQSYRIPAADRDGKDLSRSYSVTPADGTARNRIEKMEQQLANLTAWVHYQKDGTRQEVIPAPRALGRTASDSSDTFPASSASKHKGGTTPISTIATSTNHVVHSQGLSDIHDGSSGQRSSGLSSRESTPLSAQAEISLRLAQLKSDLHVLRRQQLHNMEVMKEEFSATLSQIKKVLSFLPEVENQANFKKRTKAAVTKSSYISDRQQVDKELCDLEASVEELRTDVISRQCRVNAADVEGIALLLSNAAKSLADLKARFIDIHGQMKHVLDAELNILVSEEKFLKEEPSQIENSMKRCKNISDSLSYIKRLTSARDHHGVPTRDQSLPHVPSTTPSVQNSLPDKRQALPDKAEVPMADHDWRVNEREAVFEKKEQVTTQQGALKFDKRIEISSKGIQQHSVADTNGEKQELRKEMNPGLSHQSSQEKPNTPAKPVISPKATTMHSQPAAIVQVQAAATPQVSQAATTTSTASSSAPSNISFGKMPLSIASATTKSSEKPTATVSAMTSGTPDTVTTTVIKAAVKESSPPEMKNVVMPLTQTTERLASSGLGEPDTGTISPKDVMKSPKRKDTTVYTYQVCGPVNPVFPIPPVVNKPENVDGTSSSNTSPTEIKDKITSIYSEKTRLKSCSKDPNRPPDLSLSKSESVKKGSVSFSEPPVTNVASREYSPPLNGHSPEKGDHTSQKQTARSAFFNSLNNSPNSPMSPSRNSISLDHGPVLSPTAVVGKAEQGPTINLLLTGSVSPMSPTNPGSFNITPPLEINLIQSAENKTSSSTTNSSAQGIPHPDLDSSSTSYDSQSSTISDSSSKQKKVPPPPPPRQSSRPSSSSMPPVNGNPPDLSNQQMREMPRFVGGLLGQHRLSEPLYSTPKTIFQQKPKNEPDSPHHWQQSQKNSQKMNEANTQNIANTGKECSTLDNDEYGSSSESSISSSGTVGSQQSTATVVRSSSVRVKDSSKSKPDPPRRHSSLLMKLTSSKESKSKIKNGKAKVNGVDF